MSFTLQPVLVANGSDEEGILVFRDERLVAVLTHLSQQHGDVAGWWYLEAGFGALEGPNRPTFPDLEAARQWLDERLTHRSRP
jgi:hypothetical protein